MPCRLVQMLILMFATSQHAHAQLTSYPSRPVRIIVPSSPGGGLDFVSRAMAQHLSQSWGQSVVVDNRAGAGGTIGPDLVAKAAPDGHTLLIVSATFAVNFSVYPKLPYEAKDFAPIILATSQPQILVVHVSVPARSVADLVALAKAKPGQLNYSSPGAGTLSQLAFELFKMVAEVGHRAHSIQGGGTVNDSDCFRGSPCIHGEFRFRLCSRQIRAPARARKHRSATATRIP